jgi:uncharacterized protein (DUF1330 family)
MSVYAVLDVEVHDPELYAEYQRDVPEMIGRYGGRYVTRGAPLMCLNDWKPERIVILEFPSQEDLQAFITAPEYQPLLEIRNRATTSNVVVLDGYSPA